MLALLALLFSPLVAALGDPDYRTRSAAHRHLRAAGWAAAPAVLAGCDSPDPEVRACCERLATRYPAREELYALATLYGPGWCDDAAADYWAAEYRYERLEALARRWGVYKPLPNEPGPWCYPGMDLRSQVKAFVNFGRGRLRDPGRWPWSRPWDRCADPAKNVP